MLRISLHASLNMTTIYKTISSPSRATSIPACSSSARSGRVRHQDRVGVVDVGVNLPARRRLAQHIKAAVVDGQMIHLARAASARPYLTEFSVAPERPVKHDKIRCMNCVAQLLESNCRHSARTAQFGRMCHREIEMRRCRAIQSLEMPGRSPEIEISESPSAIRFRRSARERGQAMRAQLGFRP